MIKIIHTADFHIGASFPENGIDFRKILINDFEMLCETCIENNSDILLISGDLFDSNSVSGFASSCVKEGLKKLSDNNIKCFLLPGTHDKLTKDSIYYQFPNISNVYIFGINFKEFYDERTGVYITGNAYLGADVGKRALNGLSPKKDAKINIALVHASIERPPLQRDQMLISEDEIAKSGFDYIALGHWHRYQVIRDKKPTAIYPGSIEPMSKSEIDTGNVILLECNDRDIKYSKVKIGILKTKTIDIELKSDDKTAELTNAIKSNIDKHTIFTVLLKGKMIPTDEIDIDGVKNQFESEFFTLTIDPGILEVSIDEIPSDIPKESVLGRFIHKVQLKIKESDNKENKNFWEDVLIEGIKLARRY
jgi:DNA repair exonuclease SbcCD nuclease subunit